MATEHEIFRVEEQWNITYLHAAGDVVSRFYQELRDHARLVGRRCLSCRRVLMPPRAYCDRCFVKTHEWVEVGSRGTLEAFTIVAQAFKGLPDPPYVLAYAALEHADTAILNYLRGLDLADVGAAAKRLRVGMPLVVRFAPSRRGHVTDFWFELEQ